MPCSRFTDPAALAAWVALGMTVLPTGSQAQTRPETGPAFEHHAAFRQGYLTELLPRGAEGIDLPPPPPGTPPAVVRGIYLNRWVFGREKFHSLIRLADTTEVNAFVIDVKDATGELTYQSGVPTAIAIGANRAPSVRDARERLAT